MTVNPSDASADGDRIGAAAAEWVLRLDRGLSPEEQDRFLEWLSADSRHAAAMSEHRKAWERFDRLAGLQSSWEAAPDPDLLEPARRPRRARRPAAWVVSCAAAVAASIALVVLRPSRPTATVPVFGAPALASQVARLAPTEERNLDDGSIIHLNRGAQVDVAFTAGERQVRLEKGEASFTVASDPSRPFVVVSGGVAVRALGTVFNVRRDDREVDVIVTEGRVQIAGGSLAHRAGLPLVTAGQRAIVPLEAEAGLPTIVTPAPEELTRRLAWQPRLLAFTDEPLPVILNEFNRHNPILLRIDDPALQRLRLTARFRSDNVPGFLRLLVAEFRVVAVPEADGEIVLRYAP
jgi:transmembrane sensor